MALYISWHPEYLKPKRPSLLLRRLLLRRLLLQRLLLQRLLLQRLLLQQLLLQQLLLQQLLLQQLLLQQLLLQQLLLQQLLLQQLLLQQLVLLRPLPSQRVLNVTKARYLVRTPGTGNQLKTRPSSTCIPPFAALDARCIDLSIPKDGSIQMNVYFTATTQNFLAATIGTLQNHGHAVVGNPLGPFGDVSLLKTDPNIGPQSVGSSGSLGGPWLVVMSQTP